MAREGWPRDGRLKMGVPFFVVWLTTPFGIMGIRFFLCCIDLLTGVCVLERKVREILFGLFFFWLPKTHILLCVYNHLFIGNFFVSFPSIAWSPSNLNFLGSLIFFLALLVPLSFWSFTTNSDNFLSFLHVYPLVFWILFFIFYFLDFI